MLKSFFCFFIIIGFISCAELNTLVNSTLAEPSTSEVSGGLKEALSIGVGKGSDALAKPDGYFKSAYKILLPQEIRNISEKLKIIPGYSNFENILIEKLNRGAEDAASKAKPIFIQAIKNLTITDALNILLGADDAATQYLKIVTFNSLYSEFNPVIITSLNKFNAIQYWNDAANAYNKIPLVKHVNSDLDDYVTKEALSGLFKMVENEEKNIRRNPVARVSELLKKVFAKQDSNRK